LIQFGDDPCATTTNAGGGKVAATRSLADCQRTGVTAAQYGNGLSTNTIPQATLGQLSQLTGGNPALQPETANSYTYGVTVTPTALPGFVGSIDYYIIKLEGIVGTIGADVIMSNCLDTGDPTYCSQVVRSPNTGGLVGNSLASRGYIVQTNVNVGAAEISGIDVQAGYKLG
jgi:outer membrane receptor protein involved in Fe transport